MAYRDDSLGLREAQIPLTKELYETVGRYAPHADPAVKGTVNSLQRLCGRVTPTLREATLFAAAIATIAAHVLAELAKDIPPDAPNPPPEDHS